jgi:predicted DNA-binding transcriptional regulator YafY
MDRYERTLALHRTLQAARYPVTVARLQDDLGCSRATVYRDLAFLRDALMAPVVGDGEAGFRYDPDGGGRFELPGLWLNSEELHALLAAQQLLSRSGGGVLSSALAPLQQRIEKLLDEHSTGRSWPMQRVRVIPHRGRRMDEHSFRIVCSAVLERRQLAGGYGIFSGEPKGWATIVFGARAARWVADERWHSQQQGRFLADGRYELKVPYSNARELLMDVLHYGGDAEIVEPKSLREQMRGMLQLAVANYDR